MNVMVENGPARGHSQTGWLDSYHSFSFADYHNPQRMNFGALRVLNDDTVLPGFGFDMHPHRNMEVISIPLEGVLHHRDSEGNDDKIKWGEIQVMSTGTGIYHSEYNDDSEKHPLKFLQIWIIPKVYNTPPKYKVYDFCKHLNKNEFSLILSPEEDGRPSILQDSWISIGKFNQRVATSYNLYGKDTGVYLFVLEGLVKVDGQELASRDGMGITNVNSIKFEILKNRTLLLLLEVSMNIST